MILKENHSKKTPQVNHNQYIYFFKYKYLGCQIT